MTKSHFLEFFSKLSRQEKSRAISELTTNPTSFLDNLEKHFHPDDSVQANYFEYSENTMSNYHLPYGIAPNFFVNEKTYHVPMVTEESSVVAAASSAAKFWYDKGGFTANVLNTLKNGQVHFTWDGSSKWLENTFTSNYKSLINSLKPLTKSMHQRGGGIQKISLLDKPDVLPNYYQLDISFDTVNAMGANFINTVLEELSVLWKNTVDKAQSNLNDKSELNIIMSILSNYTPECVVECSVETPIKDLHSAVKGMSGQLFAEKFCMAVQIASENISRAVTHNKGIMNGIDSVAISTGNDFRAIEANAHAYAARNSQYRSLSKASINGDVFKFGLKLPLALGTVGGLTQVHPLAKSSLEILGNPGAKELMEVTAAVGLANNFSAVKSLISNGIQAGHMKLHLPNILAQLKANSIEVDKAKIHFQKNKVSFQTVKEFLEISRS